MPYGHSPGMNALWAFTGYEYLMGIHRPLSGGLSEGIGD